MLENSWTFVKFLLSCVTKKKSVIFFKVSVRSLWLSVSITFVRESESVQVKVLITQKKTKTLFIETDISLDEFY